MPETAAAAVAEWVAFAGYGSAAASFAYGATYVLTTVAISYAAQKVLAPSAANGGAANAAVLSGTVRSSNEPRRLIYGRTRVGGVLVYPHQTPSGSIVRPVLYLGEGPIQSVDTVFWVGDELVSAPKFAGLTSLEVRLGTPGQTAITELVPISSGEWTVDDVGAGCAYVMPRLHASREAFPRGRIHMPTSFLALGRLCFDPRVNASAWTQNPALCLLDFMRSEFGPNGGVPDDLIDFDSFAAAAAVCDEVVDSIDPANVLEGIPSKVRRYTLDGVFQVDAGHTVIKETMERAMAGKVLFIGGQYRCFAGAWRAPSGPVLTGEYLRAAPTFRTHAPRTQRYNVARGTYREPLQDWQSTDFHEQKLEHAVLDEDGEIVQALEFPVTCNGAIAQRLARLAMLQARSAVPMLLECNWAAIQWQLYDVVTVDIPQVGASGTWLITGYVINAAGGIDLTLVPHRVEDFDWVPELHEQVVQQVVRPSFNTTPVAVSGLVVVGSAIIETESASYYGLSASWDASDDVYLREYQLQFKRSDVPDWETAGASFWDTSSRGTTWELAVSTGVEYDVRVRIVREDGTAGPWATETNILVSGDTEAPDAPSDLSVTGTTTHTIGWTNPTSLDVMRARVYASTTNDSTTATEVAEVFGLPATAYTTTHTPLTVPTYYWVTAVDRSGNESARTYAGVGN